MDLDEIFKLKQEIFDYASFHNCVPEIDENGILLLYFHDTAPLEFIDDIKYMTGLSLLSEDQFVPIDDAEKFKKLKYDFNNDYKSPSAVFSCQPWMRTIKKNNPPCMKRWGDLAETEQDNKRYCDQCEKPVYHIETIDELKDHLALHHCIAFQVRPDEDELGDSEDDFVFVGDPA